MATFLELSKFVTGFSDIGGDLEHDYARIMSSSDEWREEFNSLVEAFEQVIGMSDPEGELIALMKAQPAVGNAARRLAHLWYTGRLPVSPAGDADFVNEQAYFEGLIWRAARAHAPGLSGGYTGHWRYAPDG